MTGDRIKILEVPAAALARLFGEGAVHGGPVRHRVVRGVEPGAELVAAELDHPRQVVRLTLRHPTFAPIPDGFPPPVVTLTVGPADPLPKPGKPGPASDRDRVAEGG